MLCATAEARISVVESFATRAYPGDAARRVAYDKRVGRDVDDDDRARADEAVITNRDSTDDGCIRPDGGPPANDRREKLGRGLLVRRARVEVVGEHDAWAEEDIVSDV